MYCGAVAESRCWNFAVLSSVFMNNCSKRSVQQKLFHGSYLTMYKYLFYSFFY